MATFPRRVQVFSFGPTNLEPAMRPRAERRRLARKEKKPFEPRYNVWRSRFGNRAARRSWTPAFRAEIDAFEKGRIDYDALVVCLARERIPVPITWDADLARRVEVAREQS